MTMRLHQQLTELFKETGQAHHKAFKHTESEDPDWAKWYARYLEGKLGDLINREITRVEITDLLVQADKAMIREGQAPMEWPKVYADFFIARLGGSTYIGNKSLRRSGALD